MKRILPLILAAAMTLTAGTAALADNVSDALEKAATMTNDELYAKAQEEMAAGAQPRRPLRTSCAPTPRWMARWSTPKSTTANPTPS